MDIVAVESYHYEHLGRNEISLRPLSHGIYIGHHIYYKPSTSVWMIPTREVFDAACDLVMGYWDYG